MSALRIHRARRRAVRRALRRAAPLAAALLALPAAAQAQGRLVGYGTASVGLHGETVTFGGEGVQQAALGGGAGVAVENATQVSIPFSVMYPFFGGRWSLDAAGSYATGEVRLKDPDAALGGITRYRLQGFTDVRVRATGRLVGDNVVVTLGGSLPTGPTKLNGEELAALRVLAAPALGLQSPSVGLGPTFTGGVVVARQFGGWAWAGGASYEMRGEYNPVGAIAAGLPEADYDPGDAVHLSLGTEGLLGQHAMTLTAGMDLVSRDELRAGSAGAAIGEVKFGPVYSLDWTLRVGTHAFRELTLFVSDRYRTSYERDGVEQDGSDGNYLEAGVRAVRPVNRRLDLLLGLNLRHHTGLDVDDALATAATASGGLTVGLSRALGAVLVQPYVRGQFGTIDTGGESVSLTGVAFGVALGGRF